MKHYKQFATAGVALTIISVLAGCGTTQQPPSTHGTNASHNVNLSNSSATASSTTNTAYQKWHGSKSQITWDQKMYNEERKQLGGDIEATKTVTAKQSTSNLFDSDTGAIIATVSNQNTNLPLSKLTVQATRLISPSHWVATNVQKKGKFSLAFVYPGLYKVSLIQGFKSADTMVNGTSKPVVTGKVLHSEIVAVHSNQTTTIQFKE